MSRAGGYSGYWSAVNRDRISTARNLLELDPTVLPPGTHRCTILTEGDESILLTSGRRHVVVPVNQMPSVNRDSAYRVRVVERGNVDILVTHDSTYIVTDGDWVEEFNTIRDAEQFIRREKLPRRRYAVSHVEAIHNSPPRS